MSASSGALEPNWLQAYLEAAVRAKLCTRIHCTTCGAQEFRLGLLRRLEMHTGIATHGHFTAEVALAVGQALAHVQPGACDLEETIRCVLYDLWSVLPRRTFEQELGTILAGTLAGAVLGRMQEHYRRCETARQQRAEFESPAAVAARRAEQRRFRQERHAERLARKAERDRLRRSQPNPGMDRE